MTVAAVVHVALLVLSALTTTALTGYAFRNRAEHGARAFSGLVATFTVYSGAHLVGLLTTDPGSRLFLEYVQWTGTATIPVFWLLFALEYTGHDELIDRRTIGALAVVPLVTVALTWTNSWHRLMWTDNTLVVVSGLAIYDQSFGPWFWVYTVFTYVVVTLGGFLLLRLVWFSDHLYADQAILLVAGVTVPILASALSVLPVVQLGRPLLDLTPYSFVVSGFAFGYALFHHRLFDLVPATRQLGRSAVIHHLEDGVVIVDTRRRVLYFNPRAADVFDCSAAALGRPVRSLVDESAIDFDTEDALAELELDDNVYEVRTSPIYHRHGRLTGHTLVVQDITTRKRRERRLDTQHEELERLDSLNAAIRGVHRALVTATSRSEIRRAVCDHLIEDGIYRTACAADLSTLQGDGDGWTVVGADADPSALSAAIASTVPAESRTEATPFVVDPDDQPGTWTAVPLVYGPTVYGVLALRSARPTAGNAASLPDREQAVLAELGELIGHASNAVETRRLLSAESVVELSFASRDTQGTLLELADAADCELELTGLVPNAVDGHLAYFAVSAAAVDAVEAAVAERHADRVRVIPSADGRLLEWVVTDGTVVGTLVDSGAQVVSVTAADGVTKAVAEVASDADGRALVDEVRTAFPETTLVSKRTHDRPVGRADGISRGTVAELTDRQQEVLETAYRAGYFDWPRASTAEEVATALDISAPTLHGHLRKAEATLLADLFDEPTDSRRSLE